MNRILFILVVGIWNQSATADEYFRFANVVCIEEAGFFEVFATGILNISAYSKDDEIVKKIESTSNLVFGNGKVKKSCELDSGMYEVTIDYTKASATGRCMGNPGASISLTKNGTILVDRVSFDWSCDWPDIKRLTINGGVFVKVCGINYSPGGLKTNSFCIEDSMFPKDGPLNNEFIRDVSNKRLKYILNSELKKGN